MRRKKVSSWEVLGGGCLLWWLGNFEPGLIKGETWFPPERLVEHMEITRCNPTRSSPKCFSLALAHQVAHIAIEFAYLGALDIKDHICRLYFGKLIAVFSILKNTSRALAPWRRKRQDTNKEYKDIRWTRRMQGMYIASEN